LVYLAGSLVSCAVVDFKLKQIISFFELTNSMISDEIVKHTAIIDSEPRTSWSGDPNMPSRGEALEDRYQELCDLYNLNRQSSLLLSFAALEDFLLDVVTSSKLDIESDPFWTETMNFSKYVSVLMKLGINLQDPPFEYSKLYELNHRRNLIMHSGGKVPRTMREDGRMVGGYEPTITDDYVYECIGLVGLTCQNIVEKYSAIVELQNTEPSPIQ
jgi:hypothetical protein